jgi:hypothetical protein
VANLSHTKQSLYSKECGIVQMWQRENKSFGLTQWEEHKDRTPDRTLPFKQLGQRIHQLQHVVAISHFVSTNVLLMEQSLLLEQTVVFHLTRCNEIYYLAAKFQLPHLALKCSVCTHMLTHTHTVATMFYMHVIHNSKGLITTVVALQYHCCVC